MKLGEKVIATPMRQSSQVVNIRHPTLVRVGFLSLNTDGWIHSSLFFAQESIRFVPFRHQETVISPVVKNAEKYPLSNWENEFAESGSDLLPPFPCSHAHPDRPTTYLACLYPRDTNKTRISDHLKLVFPFGNTPISANGSIGNRAGSFLRFQPEKMR